MRFYCYEIPLIWASIIDLVDLHFLLV